MQILSKSYSCPTKHKIIKNNITFLDQSHVQKCVSLRKSGRRLQAGVVRWNHQQGTELEYAQLSISCAHGEVQERIAVESVLGGSLVICEEAARDM